MKFNSPKKYSGAAALLFLLIFPGLFAVFVWGVEGARILQSDARLKDATESAALAVSTQTDVTETLCDDLTKAFLNGYFPTATVETSESPCVNTEKPNEFQINASISEKTWFPNSNIASYGTSFTVSNGIKATKKIEPVDVVLVANYASTMSKNEDSLMESIFYISKKILSNNASSVKVVGFDHYVSSYNSGNGNIKIDHNIVCREQKDRTWFFPWVEYVRVSEDCIFLGGLISDFLQGIVKRLVGYLNEFRGKEVEVPVFKNLFGMIDEDSLFDVDRIDASSTVASVFNYSNGVEALIDVFLGANFNAVDRLKMKTGHSHSTYNVLNVDAENVVNLVDFKKKYKKEFVIASNTGVKGASYTGVISGARLAKEGVNSSKLIILLTDGIEEAPDVADALVDEGLCNVIRNSANYNGSSSVDMAIIGFNYNSVSGAAMKRCIGSENTYAYTGNADTDSAMLDKLLNINSKNVGRLIN